MAIVYVYPDGERMQYQGAKMDDVSHRLDHRVHGTKGNVEFDYANFSITDENAYQYAGALNDPEHDQFRDLAAAIREDQPLNEAVRVAESSMTAIMGRMSAYTGRSISWNWAMKASKLRLGPEDILAEHYPLSERARLRKFLDFNKQEDSLVFTNQFLRTLVKN